jgi:hypothetical protein
MLFNKAMSSVICQRPDFHTLSSSEVLDEFIAMNKTADNALARVWSKKALPNLALKAKAIPEEEEESCPEDTKYAYHEHMALASRQFWGQQEELKVQLHQEQLKWLKEQATSKDLLQLWQWTSRP